MNHMFHTQKAILHMSTLPYVINDSIQVWYMRVCHMQHMTHQTHHIQHNAKKKKCILAGRTSTLKPSALYDSRLLSSLAWISHAGAHIA